MTKIAVTELQYRKGIQIWEAASKEGFECISVPHQESILARTIAGHDIRFVVVGVERYEKDIYEALPEGGVIARYGVGHDGIDKRLATERGIVCINTPGTLEDSVAECTIGLMIMAVRKFHRFSERMRAGLWEPLLGGELRGKTLALIGCGAIGSRVARVAAFGFGMRVFGMKARKTDTEQLKRDFGFLDISYDFGDVVADADFVSLHIPSTPETCHFINEEKLGMMPAKAWLVNTARGAVVDEAVLFDALKDGALAGAALDVFENEPYEPVSQDKDLRSLDNVIMTPHVASSTREACNRTAVRVLQNVKLAIKERYEEMDLLNPEVVRKLRKH